MKEAIIIIITVLLTGIFLRLLVASFPFARNVLYTVLQSDIEKKLKDYSPEFSSDVMGALGYRDIFIHYCKCSQRASTRLTRTEFYKEEAEKQIKGLKHEADRLKKELADIKNPPRPAKFKIGDVIGKFAISKIGGSECQPYTCIDSNGERFFFSEFELEAMAKLSEQPYPRPPDFPPDRKELNIDPSK